MPAKEGPSTIFIMKGGNPMSKPQILLAFNEELKSIALRVSILEKKEELTTNDLKEIIDINNRIREIRIGVDHIKNQMGYRVA